MKHLENLVGSMLPADVYARFLRQPGETVLLICATRQIYYTYRNNSRRSRIRWRNFLPETA
ncbi:class I tRNA ligase family protein [Nostoc flagelliforme]|uniref:class I tRNA ligase family protein n=1 Tax=Nostoc flagelliforme TaxID=1306274 RepID=UPI0030D297B3